MYLFISVLFGYLLTYMHITNLHFSHETVVIFIQCSKTVKIWHAC